FILSAPLITVRDSLYNRWRSTLKIFERKRRLSGEEEVHLGHIRVVVFGMGRMGSAAFTAIEKDLGESLVGVEIDPQKAGEHREAGRNVSAGDATNPDFWTRTPGLIDDLEWVLLTLPTHNANLAAVQRLHEMGYGGRIAATSKYADEMEALQSLDVDFVFNIYNEAGIGFANELKGLMK
ncbi:MAG: NAD-binding protein, partial [Gammaproteobacteria bacterium]